MWRMTWQALSVRLTRDTRVYNVEDDVAGIICKTLASGSVLTPPRMGPRFV